MTYIRFSNCRVCQFTGDRKVSEDLDFKLLEGVSIEDVLGEYSKHFTDPSKPLNFMSVQDHKNHLKKQVATNLLGLPSAPAGEYSKNEIIVGDDRSNGLDSYIALLNKNKETLDSLVRSASEDLMNSDGYLAQAGTPKNQALILSVRDNIRNSIADITARIQVLITPQINNVSSKNNAQVVELLMIVKKSANLSIRDKAVKESFMKELSIQIATSKELKWLSEG